LTLESPGAAVPEIEALGPWFHNLHLPDGTETAPEHPLGDFPRFKWLQLAPHLADDLTGWRALDIGCNAGFYSFELAHRGAEVLAIDADPHYLRQAQWAAAQLGLDDAVQLRHMQVYDLPRLRERFDLVLFMGVLYHLRHPLLALDLVADRTERLLVLQTLTMPGGDAAEPPADIALSDRHRLREPSWPVMAFIERSLAGDHTNWWAPSDACVQAMARSAGLELLERPGHELYLFRPHELPDDVRRELDDVTHRAGQAHG